MQICLGSANCVCGYPLYRQGPPLFEGRITAEDRFTVGKPTLFGILVSGHWTLLVMHVYWYYAFLRLLMKLVSGQSGHEAGRDYEGQSDDDTNKRD